MRLELPPGCVTGVGSLPFADAGEAVDFVARHSPELPFWPQLPARHPHEAAIAQGLGELADLLEPAARPHCWQIRDNLEDQFAGELQHPDVGLHPQTASGFFALEHAFQQGRFPDALAVKAQSEGPVMMAHCLFAKHQPVVSRRDWFSRMAQFIARQAVWQVNRLKLLGLPVLFVIDEPVLSLVETEITAVQESDILVALNLVVSAVREVGASAGLHCCAPLPARILGALDLDYVSFDAHLSIDFEAWFDLASRIMERSGYLAFGLVPTVAGAELDNAELLAQWFRLATAAGDATKIARRTLITATCGLALSTPAAAAQAFSCARHLGSRIASFAVAASDYAET